MEERSERGHGREQHERKRGSRFRGEEDKEPWAVGGFHEDTWRA